MLQYKIKNKKKRTQVNKGFAPTTTDTTPEILGKAYIVLPGLPARLRAPKQLAERGRQWGSAKGGCWVAATAGVIEQGFSEQLERAWEGSQLMQV